jgi:hypothetical protein
MDLHELNGRSWNGNSDLSGRSFSEREEDAGSFHVVESKRPLFRKDP